MRLISLTLAALGVLGVTADQAFAEGALSYPMAAHVAAARGIHHSGHNQAVRYQEVGHYRHSSRGRYAYHGRVHRGYHGHGRGSTIIISPGCGYGYGHGAVVVPYSGYYPRSYYYVPRTGFSYHGRGFSIGIGF